jgi:succinate-acetate transporter protein
MLRKGVTRMSQSQVSPAHETHDPMVESRPLNAPNQPVAMGAMGAVADPGPLGLAGFAMTTFMLSVFNTNMLSSTLSASVLALALFYGGGVQLLAGMWEFRRGNTFGALAFSSFGAFWLAYWFYVDHIVGSLPAAEVHKTTGLFLLCWTIFTAYLAIASLRTTGAIAAVLITLTLTFLFLTIAGFANDTTWLKVGGWAGLVTAAVAWYASFAGVVNDTFRRTVLPVFPLTGSTVVPSG